MCLCLSVLFPYVNIIEIIIAMQLVVEYLPTKNHKG